MPPRVPPEGIARIRQLAAEGKSSRAIASETGIGKSSVSRYMSQISLTQVDMIEDNSARSFLSEIGISAPAAELRNETSKNPLKNNPKALMIAERLIGNVQMPQAMAPPPPPPPPPPPVPQPVELDSAQLITRIQMNVDNFLPLIKHIVKNPDEFVQSLYTKSDDELKLLLKVVERARLTGNMANQFKHIFWMTTSAVETAAPMIGVKAQGLSQALRVQDEEIQLILKEMALERADSFEKAQRPEIRLAFLVSTTLLSVDAMNRLRVKAAPKPSETYKDL